MDTLLLIDDSSIDQMICRRIVQRSGLVKTFLTFDGATQALAYLRKGSTFFPDMILLDVNMPVMTGFEFLDCIEAEFGHEFNTDILLLTTSLDPCDRSRSERYGRVSRYLHKPLTSTLLEQIVN